MSVTYFCDICGDPKRIRATFTYDMIRWGAHTFHFCDDCIPCIRALIASEIPWGVRD